MESASGHCTVIPELYRKWVTCGGRFPLATGAVSRGPRVDAPGCVAAWSQQRGIGQHDPDLLPPYIPWSSRCRHREAGEELRDGTPIPLSIIHKRGLRRDGNNPTILLGYGSHGISLAPHFASTMRAWYERGGMWAVGHLRGGGELGAAWHEAGRGPRKRNTIDDFVACAEYLIREGDTRPARLAGEGKSAGGIACGGAPVRRPDLWAAIDLRNAVTNALRSELRGSGSMNVHEYGSVAAEAGFRGLRAMDAYANVRDGTVYPAVLLTAALNDPRVGVWQAAKMAARLQAATASGKPVLLRVGAHGGHGVGTTRQQADEELADILTLVLHAAGL